jgi:4-hydroxybenzoate polyprenyltransferase
MDSSVDPSAHAKPAAVPARARLASAGAKIVADVVVYRLRNLEMANLAGAGSIALALHLPWLEILGRTSFAFGLNVLVYLNNDYFDVADDLRADGKDAVKARFLAEHLPAARAAQWALLALLTAVAIAWKPGLLVSLLCGAGVCVWYSAQLKHMPYADILSMMVWGVAMPLCGVPLHSVLGLLLALQLGLFSGVFETIQVLRDREEDAAQNVRTTAVVLGPRRTLIVARALMVLAGAYALLVMHPLAALISIGALLVPFQSNAIDGTASIPRYWTRVKLVCGCAWLVMCGFVYFAGHSGGLRFAIEGTLQF